MVAAENQASGNMGARVGVATGTGELMELDFLRSYRGQQVMEDDIQQYQRNNNSATISQTGAIPFPHFSGAGSSGGSRLDRDYLWEGDDLMFEDIVAST